MSILRKNFKPSSRVWLERQFYDPYVISSKKLGYKSRASFKLLEIDNRFSVLYQRKYILDIGCAPGGWLQVIRNRNLSANLIGVDILPVRFENARIIQGDFTEDYILATLEKLPFDLIVCDVAPNLTGQKVIDHIRMEQLLETVIEFSIRTLVQNGHLICKTFASGVPSHALKHLKSIFSKVRYFKPLSSRKQSEEMYLIALNHN